MLSDFGRLVKKIIGKNKGEVPPTKDTPPVVDSSSPVKAPPSHGKTASEKAPEKKRAAHPAPKETRQKVSPPREKKRDKNKHGIKHIHGDADLFRMFEEEVSASPDIPAKPLKKKASISSEKKSSKKKKKHHINKNGIRILDRNHDLSNIFVDEADAIVPPDLPEPVIETGAAMPPEEDFKKLLDESLFGKNRKKLMAEKDSDYQYQKPIPVAQKIKRYPAPSKELDLHGLTSLDARKRVETFLKKEQLKGALTVRVIVGKGIHSQGGAVLPDIAEDTLLALQKDGVVLAYRWENKIKSKSGAVIVYLA